MLLDLFCARREPGEERIDVRARTLSTVPTQVLAVTSWRLQAQICSSALKSGL